MFSYWWGVLLLKLQALCCGKPVYKYDCGLFGTPRSSGWRKVAQRHIELHPTCACCGGNDDLQVHHIKPYHLYPALELEPSNLITLCMQEGRSCHLVYGHLGDWLAYNPCVVDDTEVWHRKRLMRPYDKL